MNEVVKTESETVATFLPAAGKHLPRNELQSHGCSDQPYLMVARYYSSSLGRFMSVDPHQNVGKNLSNPQAWNRYTYTLNNPLKLVDPDGRKYVDSTGQGLRDKIMSRNDTTTPRGSPTGQKIVGGLEGEKEKVKVTVSSQAAFAMYDKNGKEIPDTRRVVDPAQAQGTMGQMKALAQPGETVKPIGGTYEATGVNDKTNEVTSSQITIYGGSKDSTDRGQGQTTDEFVESEFVHESDHGVGAQENENEQQIKADQKKFEDESKRK